MKYPARDSFPWLTVWGIGYLRPASGSWGSIPPVVLAGALIAGGLGPAQAPWLYNGTLAGVALVFSAACVLQGSRAEVVHGKDPSVVVADEVAGQSLALMMLPLAVADSPARVTGTLVLAFVVFRILDIVKPWPARQIQRVPGGWGILLDDLVAGAYALGVLKVCNLFGYLA
ncbi:MAG: phosphatidylglycerophosphatase A [Phycisphaeraceae bacterium]|nr:phosphatidylglycerophosphatase A [Phycisphaerae bacterium]MBX3391826.1 phosphatidylglycerophosphatase A [Phycisphaeraceae bacterium]HRJ49974.1 phosphatidylglycerophosphatase A [Phycisphaerales bacterium]